MLHKLVKDDDLSRSKHPINTNPRLPVLLLSNHKDVDKSNKDEVAVTKVMAEANNQTQDYMLRDIWPKPVLKMKEGLHVQAS